MEHGKARRDRLEGLMWLLFGAGGMVTAFVLPVHILLNNIAPALSIVGRGAVSYESLSSLLTNPLFRLYFVFMIAATVYHGMHRVRFVLYEMGLSKHHTSLTVLEHMVDALILIPAFYYLLLS